MSTEEIKQEVDQPDSITEMITSVWVKVEMPDDDVVETNDDPILVPEQIQLTHTMEQKRSKIFSCNICPFTTIYRHSLQQHKLAHQPNKPFKCDYCGHTTKYITSLKRHILYQHLVSKPVSTKTYNRIKVHSCTECSYTTQFKANLTGHYRIHTAERPFKCELCDYRATRQHHLKKHQRTHIYDEKSLTCAECGYTAKFGGHLERHMQKIHNILIDYPYKCKFCDFSAKTKCVLAVHEKRKIKDKEITCSICDFKSFNKCEVAHHQQTHFPDSPVFVPQVLKFELNNKTKRNNNRIIKCGFCEFVSTDHKEVIDHENGHFDKSSLKNPTSNDITDDLIAPKCTEMTKNYEENKDGVERPFKCSSCSYSSRFKASVERHFQRVHTESADKVCEICNFRTKTKEQLSLHNKRSIVETPVKCPNCDYTTYYKCQLSVHIRVHNSFKCPLCDLMFKTQGHLQRHQLVHSGQKPFQCRYCSYVSTRKHSLFCHESTHTGMKPYKCRVCDYSTVRKVFLIHHEKKHLRNDGNEDASKDNLDKSEMESMDFNDRSTNMILEQQSLSASGFVESPLMDASLPQINDKVEMNECSLNRTNVQMDVNGASCLDRPMDYKMNRYLDNLKLSMDKAQYDSLGYR